MSRAWTVAHALGDVFVVLVGLGFILSPDTPTWLRWLLAASLVLWLTGLVGVGLSKYMLHRERTKRAKLLAELGQQ